MDGGGSLCKVTGASGCFALDGEGVVLRVREIATPKRDNHKSEVIVGVCTEEGIELLVVGIGFVPPSLALSADVCTDGQFANVPVG